MSLDNDPTLPKHAQGARPKHTHIFEKAEGLHYVEPEGARVEHCWLIFERGHHGPPQLHWLRRDHGRIA